MGRMRAQIPREERIPSFINPLPAFPRRGMRKNEENELREIRVLVQGHTVGGWWWQNLNSSLTPELRALHLPVQAAQKRPPLPVCSSPGPTLGQPGGGSSHPPPDAPPWLLLQGTGSGPYVSFWLGAPDAFCATRSDRSAALQSLASSLLPRPPTPNPLPLTPGACDPLPS